TRRPRKETRGRRAPLASLHDATTLCRIGVARQSASSLARWNRALLPSPWPARTQRFQLAIGNNQVALSTIDKLLHRIDQIRIFLECLRKHSRRNGAGMAILIHGENRRAVCGIDWRAGNIDCMPEGGNFFMNQAKRAEKQSQHNPEPGSNFRQNPGTNPTQHKYRDKITAARVVIAFRKSDEVSGKDKCNRNGGECNVIQGEGLCAEYECNCVQQEIEEDKQKKHEEGGSDPVEHSNERNRARMLRNKFGGGQIWE